ncbi:hypothetical protein O9X81_05420 [Agrobacterium salinitolerans]|uniref:hypothetical protein n=1 Tax=Agrobacterium salinitolerans TaxID=1183413 RepID=UPI0022B847FE|nr:hypothetical protein [Agrobacterium salinitolerans]MCZ7856046.1 hypothetical protein [Agrobacterium salinitolerans]
MNSVQNHLRKYPHARTSSLATLAKRDETTAALQREIEAKRPKPVSLSWWKRLTRALGGQR